MVRVLWTCAFKEGRFGEVRLANPIKIVLVSTGTLSNVQIMIAIAVELSKCGLSPVIASWESCRGICERNGVRFHPVRPSELQIAADNGLGKLELSRTLVNNWSFVIDKAVMPYIDQTIEDLQAVMEGAVIVMTSSAEIIARIVAESNGIVQIAILLQPMALSNADDPPVFGGMEFLPKLRRAFGPWLVRPFIALTRLVARKILKRFTEVRLRLGVPEFSGDEALDSAQAAELAFTLYSQQIGPLPPGTPQNVIPAGFTYFEEGFEPATLSKQLDDFLGEGESPIAFTLGSMAPSEAAEFFQVGSRAAKSIGRKALIFCSEAERAELSHLIDSNTFVSGYVPHSQVFSRVAAVVHHGGIGTIAMAMRAGLPQLAYPLHGDQFDNAARLERFGLGRRLKQADLNVAKLAALLDDTLSDRALRERVDDVSSKVRDENGAVVVARAVRDWAMNLPQSRLPGASSAADPAETGDIHAVA